jgi:hypothetical protein
MLRLNTATAFGKTIPKWRHERRQWTNLSVVEINLLKYDARSIPLHSYNGGRLSNIFLIQIQLFLLGALVNCTSYYDNIMHACLTINYQICRPCCICSHSVPCAIQQQYNNGVTVHIRATL